MEDKIFETMKLQIAMLFRELNLSYDFSKNTIEENSKIRIYKSYCQSWYNEQLKLELKSCLTTYAGDGSDFISLSIRKWNNYKQNLEDYLSIDDYFETKLKMKTPYLEELNNGTIEEKIIAYFSWFKNNMDNTLICVLNGETWVDANQ
jgi:hypothetical protein